MFSKRTKAYLSLTVMAVIWGAALPIVKPSLEYISPFQFLFFRYLIAAPILLPVLIYYLIKLKLKANVIVKVVLLELLGVPLTLSILYQGLQLTSGLEASLLGSTTPIFTVIGGIIFLKERETKREWRGLVVSFIGTLVLIAEPIFNGKNSGVSFSVAGNRLILLYNLLNTVYLIAAKKVYKKLPKIFISSLSYPVALISLGAVLILLNQPINLSLLAIPSVALASGYMAILGSIIALTLLLYGQNLIEVSEASLFTYLQGIIAIPAAWIILGEIPTFPMMIAIILVAGGVIIAEKRV